VQGSILGFIPREQKKIYDRFMAGQQTHCQTHKYDQDFLTQSLENVHYWPPSWTASFKRHCLTYYPFNKWVTEIKRPREAKVVVFHGEPRPLDVVRRGCYRWGTKRKFGYGPVPWVREYWLRHDSQSTDSLGDDPWEREPAGHRRAG
jgi:hypothetical protein